MTLSELRTGTQELVDKECVIVNSLLVQYKSGLITADEFGAALINAGSRINHAILMLGGMAL